MSRVVWLVVLGMQLAPRPAAGQSLREPAIRIDRIERAGTAWQLAGRVRRAPPGSVIRVFAHSDGHHLIATWPARARFGEVVRLDRHSDRLVLELGPAGSLQGTEGCDERSCRGMVSLPSGYHVPRSPESTEARAFAVAYLERPGDHPDPRLDALSDLLKGPRVGNAGSLARSTWESELCYLYDQALAAIAFVHGDAPALAERVLDALSELQLSDGSWYFVTRPDGRNAEPRSDRRITGAIAWAALAFAHYRRRFRSERYNRTLHRALDHLRRRMRTETPVGLPFNGTDLPHSLWDERSVVSFEHNADALAAFRVAAEPSDRERIAVLNDVLEGLWLEHHFAAGASPTGLDRGLQLDPQTWGLLALNDEGVRRHAGALRTVCRELVRTVGGRVAAVTAAPASGRYVWSEGAFGLYLALRRATAVRGSRCAGVDARALLRAPERSPLDAGLPGAVAEATGHGDSPYRSLPTLAATAWAYFAEQRINPLQ